MASSGPSRRPRLSLQTKSNPGPHVRSSKSSLANVNPRSPTAFNTLSNVYVTAIERSTPVQSTPLTAINIHQPLKIQTDPESLRGQQQRVQTPFTATLPDTPLSANPMSPVQQVDIIFPSSMTATPPMSAGSEPKMFTFASNDARKQVLPSSPAPNYRRVANMAFGRAPYSHNRSLHSILRNSPLPPSSSKSPISPRRQSLRLQEKAARRVGYESPLTQTITTEKYTKSHIDLLAEEASPYTPSPVVENPEMVLDLTMAYSGDETRDGGQTPGPFEEMRRRMAGLRAGTPLLSPRPDGVRKRKRKERKRRWVWTIGQDDENESGEMAATKATTEASTPRATAPTKAATPEPLTAVKVSVESVESGIDTSADRTDIEMLDTSGMPCRGLNMPCSMELDQKTPTMSTAPDIVQEQAARLESIGPTDLNMEKRGDTPIPPDLTNNEGQG